MSQEDQLAPDTLVTGVLSSSSTRAEGRRRRRGEGEQRRRGEGEQSCERKTFPSILSNLLFLRIPGCWASSVRADIAPGGVRVLNCNCAVCVCVCVEGCILQGGLDWNPSPLPPPVCSCGPVPHSSSGSKRDKWGRRPCQPITEGLRNPNSAEFSVLVHTRKSSSSSSQSV